MSADYPRDLVGYGSNPPHPHWPGNARIALSFVLNYEEGGERNILTLDLKTLEYREKQKAKFAALEMTKNIDDPRERLKALFQFGHRQEVEGLA